MYIDKDLVMSDDQAVTITANSTHLIDLGDDSSLVQALNSKGNLELLVQVTETFVGGTSVAVTLKSDNDVAFGSPLTVLDSGAVVTASLVQGYQFKFGKLPRINEQYIRMTYTCVGNTYTAGKIFATLVIDRQTNNA
jgi:hypothetical protein